MAPCIQWSYAVTANLRWTYDGTTETVSLTLDGTETIAERLAKLELAMETHTSAPAVAITLQSDFKVRITLGGFTGSLLWADAATTLDATIFGWDPTANFGPFATLNAPNVTGGLWRPGKDPEEDTDDVQRVVGGAVTALSGKHRASYFSEPYATRDARFGLLLPEVAEERLAASGAPHGTIERAWLSCMSRGRAFYYTPDETDLTTYTAYKLREPTRRPIERDERFPAQRWQAPLEMRRIA